MSRADVDRGYRVEPLAWPGERPRRVRRAGNELPTGTLKLPARDGSVRGHSLGNLGCFFGKRTLKDIGKNAAGSLTDPKEPNGTKEIEDHERQPKERTEPWFRHEVQVEGLRLETVDRGGRAGEVLSVFFPPWEKQLYNIYVKIGCSRNIRAFIDILYIYIYIYM